MIHKTKCYHINCNMTSDKMEFYLCLKCNQYLCYNCMYQECDICGKPCYCFFCGHALKEKGQNIYLCLEHIKR